jgi:hypothetical protein
MACSETTLLNPVKPTWKNDTVNPTYVLNLWARDRERRYLSLEKSKFCKINYLISCSVPSLYSDILLSFVFLELTEVKTETPFTYSLQKLS